MLQQRTLAGVVGCEGIALHAGESIQVIIHPASEGTGICFLRSDLDDAPSIQAHARHVTDTFYATTLSSGGVSIGTVEHLMAALFSMGITNAAVHVKGTELPILDGSAKDWLALIRQVGVVDQRRQLPEIVIRKPVGVKSHNQWATLYPYEGFSVDCTIEFDHPLIGKQCWKGDVSPSVFEKELSEARTFGLLRDAAHLYSCGRARGANFENVIVLDERQVVTPGGLRFTDEFVRHKVLDAIGDLSLLGLPIRGLLVSHRSGHKLHQQLLRVLLDSRDCWEFSAGNLETARQANAVARRNLQLVT